MKADNELRKLAKDLHTIATWKHQAEQHILNQLAHPDPNPPDETGITTKNRINDPTAHQALQRTHITNQQHAINTAMATLQRGRHDLMKAITNAIPRQPTNSPLCNGGDPSTWGDPTCNELVGSFQRGDGTTGVRSDGLCDRHRMRKHRWEKDNAA